MRLTSAEPVHTSVHDNAVQPGGDSGFTTESGRGSMGGEHRLLQGVRGVFAIAYRPQGHCPQSIAVTVKECGKRERITRGVGQQELRVVAWV